MIRAVGWKAWGREQRHGEGGNKGRQIRECRQLDKVRELLACVMGLRGILQL